MLNVQQFRELIVRQTLKDVGLWSQAAENLLVGTALIESRLTFLVQMPSKIAKSVYQMEDATYKDILITVQKAKNIPLYNRILMACKMQTLPIDPNCMIGNMTLATIMARLKYYFNSNPIPDANDINKLADYYKLIYNTPDGAAKTADFISLYNQYAI